MLRLLLQSNRGVRGIRILRARVRIEAAVVVVAEVLQVEANTRESEVVMSRRKRQVEMSWLDIVGVWIVWEVILSKEHV